MTLKDDVHLRWVNFDTNIRFILNELYRTKEYADVTLVSDDQKPFKAHKPSFVHAVNFLEICS